MINKKNIWFMTLFSLVLVLSIYYITMPNELLKEVTETANDEIEVSIEESNIIETMKIEDDEEVSEEISKIEQTLTDLNISIEDKNKAYEKLKSINKNSSKEEQIEKNIFEEYQCNAFAKIKDDEVRVVVDNCEKSTSLANNIMRLTQEQFDSKMYISVQFE